MSDPQPPRPVPSEATLASLHSLQEILDTQAEGYRRLLTTIERQRESIRNADLASVPDVAEGQRRIIERLQGLDERREAAGRALATAIGIDPESGISAISAELPVPAADRLEVRAAELRELVERSRREQSMLKSAGEALARHMAGIVQSVTGTLSGTGVYGRRGRIREGSPLVAGIDMTS